VSVDFEVRSDDDYSRQAPASEARTLLAERWGVKDQGDGMLVYDRDKCHVEVTLGTGETAVQGAGNIRCIGLRVPAGARFESGKRAVEIGIGLAQALGWRLHDPQGDRYIDPGELEPGRPLREEIAQLAAEVRREPAGRLMRRLWARTRRQSFRSVAEIAFGGTAVGLLCGRVSGLGMLERPELTLGIAVVVTVLVVGADIVVDVVGEIHTDVGGGADSTAKKVTRV
jgi:hypothetical protein